MDTNLLLALAHDAGNSHWNKMRGIFKLNTPVPSFRLNNRYKTTAGYCEFATREISLSTELFHYNQSEFIKIIIPHELIHQVDFDLHGKVMRPHSPRWKNLMVQYGLPPDTYHNLRNPLHEKRKAK